MEGGRVVVKQLMLASETIKREQTDGVMCVDYDDVINKIDTIQESYRYVIYRLSDKNIYKKEFSAKNKISIIEWAKMQRNEEK